MKNHKILTRDFVLIFFAQFTLSFVFHILIPTLPIYLSRSGSTEETIGVLIGTFFISSLVLRPFVGRAFSKISERNFMIAGALLYAFSSAAYLLAPPFWPFFVVRIFHGIGMAFFNTSAITLIAAISPEAHLGQSISYFYISFNISFALAPSFGMFLINLFGFPPLFFFCIGLSLCSLFLTTRIAKRQVEGPDEAILSRGAFISREAIPPAIMAFFAHIIWGALTTFFPLYAIENGVKNPGFFFGAFAIMLILGRTLGGKLLDLYSREKVILPCLTTYIISMALLAFSKTLPLFILVAVIWGSGNALFFPAVVAYIFDRVGSSRGPAMGTYTAISDLGIGVGALIMGGVLRLTSYPVMFLCLALTGLVNLSYFLFLVKKRDKDNHGYV